MFAMFPSGGKQSVFEIGTTDVLQSLDKVIEDFGRYHDSVAVGTDFFGNANHSASGIALEVDEKGLAIRDDFFCANDIVFHFSEWVSLLYAPLCIQYHGVSMSQSINANLRLVCVKKCKKA